jgi:hypothetical protein
VISSIISAQTPLDRFMQQQELFVAQRRLSVVSTGSEGRRLIRLSDELPGDQACRCFTDCRM